MVKSPVRCVLDTNILLSALVFGGKPERIVRLVLDKEITAITSLVLLAELIDVLTKKFVLSKEKLTATEVLIKRSLILVTPRRALHILADEDDNRILEAAIEGECAYIITGDKALLKLKKYKTVKVLTTVEFLHMLDKD